LAQAAALAAGFPAFQPEACLINRYQVGVVLALHQDRDERALTASWLISPSNSWDKPVAVA
jgi:alkylated DNA repair protein (DNA oxidative demethylase)